MDELDFQLVSALFRVPFSTLQEVGRSLGVSGTTIKSRVAALQREGVLDGFWAIPAAEAFGCKPTVSVFSLHDESGGGILKSGLKRSAGSALSVALSEKTAVWAKVFERDSLAVLTFGRRPELTPRSLVEAFGEPDMVQAQGWPRPDSEAGGLSPLDWKVMRGLVRNPRGTPAALAADVGVTEKTARFRRDRLVDHGWIHIQPVINGARSGGIACFYLAAFGASKAPPPEVASLVPGIAIEGIANPPATIYLGRAPSRAQAVRFEELLHEVPGVKVVGMAFRSDSAWDSERLSGWIEGARPQ